MDISFILDHAKLLKVTVVNRTCRSINRGSLDLKKSQQFERETLTPSVHGVN